MYLEHSYVATFSPSWPPSIYLLSTLLTLERSAPCAQVWRKPAAGVVGVGAAVAAAVPDRGSCVGDPVMDLEGRRSDS